MGNSLCRGGDDISSPVQSTNSFPSHEGAGLSEPLAGSRQSQTNYTSAVSAQVVSDGAFSGSGSSHTPIEAFQAPESANSSAVFGEAERREGPSSASEPVRTPRPMAPTLSGKRLPPAPPSHQAPKPPPPPEPPAVPRLADGGIDMHREEPQANIRWQRGELIGAGAFGRVYMGLNQDTGELMAVKQVLISPRDHPPQGGVSGPARLQEHVAGLEVEVGVLRGLQHENIVRYMGTERTLECLNIFLEYVPGGSIASLLNKFGSFQEKVVRMYTRQLLTGLDYLHKHQIIHRDIKGANVLVDNSGTVKLADFGASKKIEDLVTIESGYKSIKGTPYWMAPEVIRQEGHGRQADIWSLGCTVLEMFTGKPPWSQFSSQVSALFHIASSTGPPPIPDTLSTEATDFLLLCFKRVPKERPNAAQLLKHPFLAGGPLPPGAPVHAPKAKGPPRPWQPQPGAPPMDPIEESFNGMSNVSLGEALAGARAVGGGEPYISSSEDGSTAGGAARSSVGTAAAPGGARGPGSSSTQTITTPTAISVGIPGSPYDGPSPYEDAPPASSSGDGYTNYGSPGLGGSMHAGGESGYRVGNPMAASVASSVASDINPIEEPSWLHAEHGIPLDTGSMHVEGVYEAPRVPTLPPTNGKGDPSTPPRLGVFPPSPKGRPQAVLSPLGNRGARAGGGSSEPVDETSILDWVRSKATEDTERLTTPFRADNGAVPAAPGPPGAGGAGGSGRADILSLDGNGGETEVRGAGTAGAGGGAMVGGTGKSSPSRGGASYRDGAAPKPTYSTYDPYDIPLSSAATFQPNGGGGGGSSGGAGDSAGGAGGALGSVGHGGVLGGGSRRDAVPAVTLEAQEENVQYQASLAKYEAHRQSKKAQWEAELQAELERQRLEKRAQIQAHTQEHESLVRESQSLRSKVGGHR